MATRVPSVWTIFLPNVICINRLEIYGTKYIGSAFCTQKMLLSQFGTCTQCATVSTLPDLFAMKSYDL